MAELTVEGVPIDGIVAVGQRVQGRHDPGRRLLDLRDALLSVPVAVAATSEDDAAAPETTNPPERRGAARTLSLTVDTLRAALRGESARLQASERDEATLRAHELEVELAALREELRSTRTRLRNQVQQLNKEREARKAERRGTARGGREEETAPAFLDPQQQWRHEVYLAWVDRIPATDKAARPLPARWLVGPQFLDSLETLEGISRQKVAAVVVEALTGLAKDLPGRDLHRLRTSAAGGAPAVTREDGAVATVRLSAADPTGRARTSSPREPRARASPPRRRRPRRSPRRRTARAPHAART